MHRLLTFLLMTTLMALVASCSTLPDLEQLAAPRYQAGGYKGAAYCATCHPDTHEQWSKYSRHAKATSSPSFQKALAEVNDNLLVGGIVKKEMCYACHGDAKINEGINCESCHGPPLRGVDIMDTHEKKYTPRLKIMRRSDFCPRCHQVKMPFTGQALTSLHDEWKQSTAGKKGKTCQNCHMAKGEDDDYAFHGFKTATRNASLYRGKLVVSHIAINKKRLRLYITNRVTGHAIPASGPTRILALETRLLDKNGQLIHRETRRFYKHFSMLPVVGGMPFLLINNSQLQSGEKRMLRFKLPAGVYEQAVKLALVLRMYEVADKYEGDISKAHWTSKPIISQTIKLTH